MVNQNGQSWDYVETTVNGLTVRGFVPAGNLTMAGAQVPDLS